MAILKIHLLCNFDYKEVKIEITQFVKHKDLHYKGLNDDILIMRETDADLFGTFSFLYCS